MSEIEEVPRCGHQYRSDPPPDPALHTRIVRCGRYTGHTGEHEEADTGITWPRDVPPPMPAPPWREIADRWGQRLEMAAVPTAVAHPRAGGPRTHVDLSNARLYQEHAIAEAFHAGATFFAANHMPALLVVTPEEKAAMEERYR